MTSSVENPERVSGNSATPTVLFVCLHGSAKSLIAAQYFLRAARERGLAYAAESAGVDPDAEVPEPVAAALDRDGFNVHGYAPQALTAARLENASRVINLGCELPEGATAASTEVWNDLPMVSDGYERARDAIVVRVYRLIESLK